jgi:O-antigen ligase
VAISLYLACVALFFVMLMLDHTERRIQIIVNAQIVASVIAATTGTLGYFDVLGSSSVFTSFEGSRASGMFKDPNVFGPFITLGATALFHGLLTGRIRWFWLSLFVLGFLCFAVLISFSRGAWGVLLFSLLMVIGMNLMVSRTWRERRRIIVVAGVGLAGLVLAGMAALSAPGIASKFSERAKLFQTYDSGETGRFGKQKRSIPMLLEQPNGFGPLQFNKIFGENPHNVYIFAFSSYGWLGGIAYLALIAMTLLLGWRLIFQRTPLQHHAILLWCVLFPQILQGIQIDTDHWRHFWWLVGMCWGMAIVSNRWLASQRTQAKRSNSPA